MEKWNLSLASQMGGIQTLERMNQKATCFCHGSHVLLNVLTDIFFEPGEDQRNG